jgi:hypothetical protein
MAPKNKPRLRITNRLTNTFPQPKRIRARKRFKEFDPEGTESIDDWKKVFMDCSDPTEYEPAVRLCGSWSEWERFKRHWPGFALILKNWHNELEIKLRSQAVKQIIAKTDKDVNAAKWVAKGEYKKQTGERTSKTERERENFVRQEVARVVDRDAERVLKLIDITPEPKYAVQ